MKMAKIIDLPVRNKGVMKQMSKKELLKKQGSEPGEMDIETITCNACDKTSTGKIGNIDIVEVDRIDWQRLRPVGEDSVYWRSINRACNHPGVTLCAH
jgi:hypothetical protein